ncbi:hypothetical protein JCM6882_002430 [Rhodosporidiobolus microsporus]
MSSAASSSSTSHIPTIPNELITLIFTHLFRSLGVSAAQEELDLPLLAPFVFAPFLRVSKTWYHLALPFFVRFVDNGNSAYIAQLVKKHSLERHVETVYVNPVIPLRLSLTPEPDQPESIGYTETWDAEEVVWSKKVGLEANRWRPLIEVVAPTLRRLEVGWRGKTQYEGRRPKSEPGFDEEDAVHWTAGKAIATVLGSKGHLPSLPSLTHLRINLLPGADFVNYAHVIARSPNLDTLIVASYTRAPYGNSEYGEVYPDLFWTRDLPPPSLPLLRRFELRGFRAPAEYFKNNIVTGLLKENRHTLRHLHIELDTTGEAAPGLFNLFRGLEISAVESLVFQTEDPFLFLSDNFFSPFPALRQADLACYGRPPTPFPATLTHLTLTANDDFVYRDIVLSLAAERVDGVASPFSGIRTIVLDGEPKDPTSNDQRQVTRQMVDIECKLARHISGNFTSSLLDEEYHPGSAAYAALEAAAAGESEGDADGGEDAHDSEDGDEDSDGDDLEWDWEAEEGQEFFHRWSSEKQRACKLDFLRSAFEPLRPSFPSHAAFEASREEAVAAFARGLP